MPWFLLFGAIALLGGALVARGKSASAATKGAGELADAAGSVLAVLVGHGVSSDEGRAALAGFQALAGLPQSGDYNGATYSALARALGTAAAQLPALPVK